MKLFKEVNPQRAKWNFVGIARHNKGKTYREYAESEQDAILGICTGHRMSPKDIQLVRN